MKKSIFLFFAAILCAMSVNAKDIYADMSSAPSWYADAYIHYWDGSSDKYVKLEETGISKLLKATINDNYQGWRVCRYVDGVRHNDCTWISDKNVNKFIVNSNGDGGSSTTIIGLVTGGHIYFDKLETQWTGNIQFVVGHDSYSRTYEMTQISDTHLWYVNLTDKDYHTWGDAKYYGFIASGSKFEDGGWGSSNLKKATSYTKAYTSTYSLNEGAIYYCKMSATANGSTFSIDYKGSKNDIPKCDATQAAKVRNSKTVAYTNVTNTWPATLTLEGTYLKTNSTTERTLITSTTSTDDANKRVYGAVTSGKITHTYSNLNDDYHFEGWGTGDAPTSTNASYEYNITANTTVYAFFTKKYAVNFSADANGSVAATADEQALTSGNKVVGGTEVTLTATANPGYKFVNWTKAGVEVSTDATYSFTATENVDLVANFAKVATVTVEDPIGSMSTYTGVEKNGDVWSKEYNVGDEVTLNIAALDPDLVFAYWSVGAEKIFTEEYTFTASEDVTVTAVYALPMEVTFDNMTLDTDSWIVEAGPDAEYGVTVTLGIDVEGEHPKGFGLVDGSSISLGEDELELVTGYFTDVDQDAPSAEAVIIAVYAEELMAFVCTMSAAATPAIPVEVLNGVATPNDVTGELWITGQWEGDDVYVQVPVFDGVSFDCPEIWFYVGGTDFETASIIARGPATITVEDGDVSVEGTVTSGATSTDYELLIIGTLPAAVTTIDVTLSGMQKGQISRVNKRGYIALEDGAGNNLQIYNESAEWAYGEYTVTGELVEYGVTVQGTGIWNLVDGVETLVATLQVEDDNTTIYNVVATVGAATTITLECWDATYTITDPEYNEVTFTGVADGKEFTILVSYFGGEYYSEGEWGETFIYGTEVEFDDSDAESYYLGGTYIDDANNTYEVAIFGAPAAVAPTPDYTRTTTAGKFGTICLPFGSTNYTGMELFECVGREPGKVYIASVTKLEAGVPYIFLATGTELAVYSDGTTAATPGDHNGLHGTFTDDTEVAVGNYILKDNALCQAETTCWVNANRAYLVMGEVPAGAPQQMPGRKYIGMSTKGENATTSLDNITNGENTTIKVIENGQLIIIRNGEKFNAQGIQL